VLLILYWLENVRYTVKEDVLIQLLELTGEEGCNSQPLLHKYLDQSMLLSHGMRVDWKQVAGMEKSREDGSLHDGHYDPVTKEQLMFYL
jgi:uncharacterized protein YprB with RNaseH-like and TPR domain